jgi:large subunit ribosomal protein L29
MSQRTKTLKKYRDMEAGALSKEEADLRNAVWKLKLQKGTGQIADPHKLEGAKRDLARVMTVQREREAAPAVGKRS